MLVIAFKQFFYLSSRETNDALQAIEIQPNFVSVEQVF